MTGMRTVSVLEALGWAYREELPKDGAGGAGIGGPAEPRAGWTKMGAFGELLAVVENRYGVVPFDEAFEAPHPDAVALAAIVDGLAEQGDARWQVPGFAPFADMPEVEAAYPSAADEADRRAARPVDLVRRFARGGRMPVWRHEAPAADFERRADGAGPPRWFVRRVVDGREVETQAPNGARSPGAYRKRLFRPDPMPIAVARMEWALFVGGLELVRERAALSAMRLAPVRLVAQPWRGTGEDGTGRVLRDLGQARVVEGEVVRGRTRWRSVLVREGA